MVAGDTVVVEDGVYTSGSTHVLLIDNKSGLPGKYITFKARNPHAAIIDGSNFTNHSGIALIRNSAYIRIEGFTIRKTRYRGIGVSGDRTGATPDNIEIINNVIQYVGNEIITDTTDTYGRAGVFTGAHARHVIIEQNIIHDIGRLPESEEYQGGHAFRHDHGLYLQGKYHIVNNNRFFNNKAGWSIKVDGYYGDEINESERTHIITNNRFRPEVRSDSASAGHIRFYNNRTYNETFGYMKHAKNVLIENNSFYKSGGPAGPEAIIITNIGNSNFEGTVLKGNITTETMLYDTTNLEIVANITDIENVINAPVSMFLEPPSSIKIMSSTK